MGFREFITSRLFRRRIEVDSQRYANIQPPANPSRRYIDRVVRRLLDSRAAWGARKKLSPCPIERIPCRPWALTFRLPGGFPE
jgi:hypothetical protein